jgi:hypothetical protein
MRKLNKIALAAAAVLTLASGAAHAEGDAAKGEKGFQEVQGLPRS